MDGCRERKNIVPWVNWWERRTNYYEVGKEFAQKKFAAQFARLIAEQKRRFGRDTILFLGIGSDRITGDCLGPLVGYKLEKMKSQKFFVEGTLASPVHAMNLQETMERVEQMCPSPLVVALDASVGSEEHLGLITLASGGLQPGLGVNKRFPEVGHISITGIVTSDEVEEPFYLQQIPLSMVMEMADCICQGVAMGMKMLHSI